MKIRQGFVSNSSSSSFVVYIPEKMEFKDLHFGAHNETMSEYEADEEEIEELFNTLKMDGCLNEADVDAGDEYGALLALLEASKLVVVELGAGPDEGNITLITDEDIKQVVTLQEQYK